MAMTDAQQQYFVDEEDPRTQYNRAMKPLMEKRRRARINACLDELKSLLQTLMGNSSGEAPLSAKLEKADILEMAVRFLSNIEKQKLAAAVMTDPSALNSFRSGYVECSNEVNHYLQGARGIDHEARSKLMSHLTNTVQHQPGPLTATQFNKPISPVKCVSAFNNQMAPIHVQCPPLSLPQLLPNPIVAASMLPPTPMATPERVASVPNTPSPLSLSSSASPSASPDINVQTVPKSPMSDELMALVTCWYRTVATTGPTQKTLASEHRWNAGGKVPSSRKSVEKKLWRPW